MHNMREAAARKLRCDEPSVREVNPTMADQEATCMHVEGK